MKFAAFLSFWMAHNESIIQWMVATIIGFSTFLVFRSFFGKKTGDVATAVGIDPGMQELLKKVLDQTTVLEKAMMSAPTVVAAPAGEATAVMPAPVQVVSGADPAELEKLKKMIEDRDVELNRLKNDPSSGKLRDQIDKVQELENRLKEYEILEDDIADLSLYKEENARLKSELQRLVGGAAPAAEPAAAPAPVAAAEAVAPAPAAVEGDALVDQFAKVVDQTKGMETAIPSTEGMSNLPQTGDPMADFQSAVQKEKSEAEDRTIAEVAASLEPAPAAPATEPAPAVAAEPAPAPAAVASADAPALSVVPPVEAQAAPAEESAAASMLASEATEQTAPSGEAAATDLFAEFSTGNLDTDRVMEEMASLDKMPAADGKDALEGDVDADKMVAEAAGFSKN